MIRVLFQGDSITDGNRYKDPSSRWDLNHQIGHSYVFVIASELGKKHPGKYAFINRGVSGDSVESITARWKEDTLDENPNVLSLLLGTNGNGERDGTFPEGTEVHLRNFEMGYRALLDSARANNPNLKLIIMEPFFLPVGRFKTTYDAFLPVFAEKQQIIRRIAADYGAVFVPVQAKLEKLVQDSVRILKENGCDADPYEYWLWDGIHPTEAMHGVLAELWLDAAKYIL